ncbi:MAG: hypothetical protein GWO87_01760 [Xanthomonadaceae bacterium]|nr:hypothetical protein [Rhodospirillaceae bacterium]NIA17896.1 hypothetical protein [Xanthomonadaceae bacterium]
MPSKNSFKIFYALSFAWQLGFFIIVPVGGFMFIGFLGDKFLNTQPLFLIFGFLVGALITIYGVYSLLIPIIKKEKNKN